MNTNIIIEPKKKPWKIGNLHVCLHMHGMLVCMCVRACMCVHACACVSEFKLRGPPLPLHGHFVIYSELPLIRTPEMWPPLHVFWPL